jgi:hypothetical protein
MEHWSKLRHVVENGGIQRVVAFRIPKFSDTTRIEEELIPALPKNRAGKMLPADSGEKEATLLSEIY